MTTTSTHGHKWLLRIAAILWIVWGAVHVAAGVLTISADATGALQGIADAVDPASLEMVYPDALGALINQHGFNLLWFGIVTAVCGVYIWRGSAVAIFLAALVGGLADAGYFIFVDLGGFVKFAPGTLMTLVSSGAIITSVWGYLLRRRKQS